MGDLEKRLAAMDGVNNAEVIRKGNGGSFAKNKTLEERLAAMDGDNSAPLTVPVPAAPVPTAAAITPDGVKTEALKRQRDEAMAKAAEDESVITASKLAAVNPRAVLPGQGGFTAVGERSATEAAKRIGEDSAKAYQAQKDYDAQRYFTLNKKSQEKGDFSQKSGYKSTANGSKVTINPVTGRVDESGFDDILYDYVNGNEQAKRIYESNRYGKTAAQRAGLKEDFVKYMTDADRKVFNYTYATEGRDAAVQYLKDLYDVSLSAKEREDITAQYAKEAEEHPVWSSIYTVLTSPASVASYIGQAVDLAKDGEINQNAAYNRFSYIPTSMRSKVAERVESKYGKVGSFLYQTGMSMADFAFTTLVSGGFGGAAGLSKASEALALGIMGSNAAANTVIESKDKGLSDTQAFALGTVAGLAEALTEKVSIDKLFSPETFNKSVLQAMAKNALFEGSEEAASDAINWVADVLISKDRSEWVKSIEAYKSTGMSQNEAFLAALKDQLISMGISAAGGALSGAALGGAVRGLSAVADTGTGRDFNARYDTPESLLISPEDRFKRGAQSRYDADVQSFIDYGLTASEDSDAYREAQAAQAKVQSGERLSDLELGRLIRLTSEMRQTEAETPVQEEVRGNPVEAGQTVTPAVRNTPVSGNAAEGRFLPNTEVREESGENPSVGAADLGFSPFSRAENEYGVQETTANAVRPADVPVSIDGGKRISQIASNLKGARITPESAVPSLEKRITEGAMGYLQITNDEEISKAIENINALGWDEAVRKFKRAMSKGVTTPTNMAMGMVLYNHAVTYGEQELKRMCAEAGIEYENEAGRITPEAEALALNSDVYDEAFAIVDALQSGGTATAQALQMFREIRKMSASMRLHGIMRTVEYIKAELGVNIDLSQEAVDAYRNAVTDAARELAIDKIADEAAAQMHSSGIDRFKALRYLNMLGNFRTQVRNVSGNAVQAAFSAAKDAVFVGLENITKLTTKGKYQPTKSIIYSADQKAAAAGDWTKEIEALTLGTGKQSIYEDVPVKDDLLMNAILKGIEDKRAVFQSDVPGLRELAKGLEGARKLTNLAMDKGDVLFTKRHYIKSLASQLAARKITGEQWRSQKWQAENAKLAGQIRQRAILDAQENTYRDRNWFSDWVIKIGRRRDTPVFGKVIGEGIAPFRRTPANVAKRIVEQSPLSVAEMLVRNASLKNKVVSDYTDTISEVMAHKTKGRYNGIDIEYTVASDKKSARVTLTAGDGTVQTRDVRGSNNTVKSNLNAVAGQMMAKMTGEGGLSLSDVLNGTAKAITGTALMVLGFAFARAGFIRGKGSDDDNEKYFDEQRGLQEYSVVLPNGWSFTLDWASPPAVPLFMGANLAEMLDDENITFADMSAVFSGMFEPLIQMSMLQGINDTLADLKYSDNNTADLIANTALSYLFQGITNTLVGQAERTAEGKRMQTVAGTQKGWVNIFGNRAEVDDSQLPKNFKRLVAKASAKIPGVDYRQSVYIDGWGREDSLENRWATFFEQTFSPAYVSKDKTTDVDIELLRLVDNKSVSSSILPQSAPHEIKYTVNGVQKTVDLTDEDYPAFAKKYGNAKFELAKKLIGAKEYKRMSDADKADALDRAFSYAEAQAIQTVAADYPSAKWVRNAKDSGDATQFILDYVQYDGKYSTDSLYAKSQRAKKELNCPLDKFDFVYEKFSENRKTANLQAVIEANFPKSEWRTAFDIIAPSSWKNPY